jgi:hypothetical protein
MFPATESKKNQSIPNLASLIMLNKSHCGEWKIEVLPFHKCVGKHKKVFSRQALKKKQYLTKGEPMLFVNNMDD